MIPRAARSGRSGPASVGSKRRSFQSWAVQLFQQALPACAETTSPRTWALALIGIHEYLRRFSGDRQVDQMRDTLTDKLVDLFERTATDDWPWFEDVALLRQRQAVPRPDPERPVGRERTGPGDRPALAALVGRQAVVARGAVPPDRLQRILPTRGDRRRVRSAADRSPCHGLRCDRSPQRRR